MSPRRPAFGAVVVAVLALALWAGGGDDRGSDRTIGTRTVASSADADAVWFCPGLPSTLARDERVTFANVGTTPAAVTVTVRPDGGAPAREEFTVAAATVTTRGRRSLGPDGALTVESFGGRLVVDDAVSGPAGSDVSACAPRSSTSWYFPAGSTVRGAEYWLVVDDPYASDAKVDVTVYTETGVRRPERLQGVDVARRSRVLIPLHDIVVRERHVGLELEARVGRVVASQVLVFTADSGTPGVAATVGATTGSDHWMLPDASLADDASSVVAIKNLGPDAEVLVGAVTDDGEPLPPVELSVGEDDVVTVQLGNCDAESLECLPVPRGARYALDVRADEGGDIVVQALARAGSGSARPGVAAAFGVPADARTWLLPSAGAGAGGATVAILNVSPDAARVAVALVHDGRVERPRPLRAIEIRPGRRVSVNVARGSARGEVALRVESSAPVAAEGISTTGDDVSHVAGVRAG
jgi:hypothetical protein